MSTAAEVVSEPTRRAEILVVEDNPADQVLFREAMKLAHLDASIHFVGDGIKALEYLKRTGPFSKALKPDVILLDFNLPMKDGKEILAEVKQDAELCEIPILVLSTSNRPEDVLKAYELGAVSYLTKPSALAEYLDLVQQVITYAERELPKRKA